MSPSSTQPAPVYDTEYFIKKFEAIPDDQWCMRLFTNGAKKCALGHCGARRVTHLFANGSEARSLHLLLGKRADRINDGVDPRYPQPHPKARILAALGDKLREQQEAALRDLAGKEGA